MRAGGRALHWLAALAVASATFVVTLLLCTCVPADTLTPIDPEVHQRSAAVVDHERRRVAADGVAPDARGRHVPTGNSAGGHRGALEPSARGESGWSGEHEAFDAAVLGDWAQCSLLWHIHVSKAGGNTLQDTFHAIAGEQKAASTEGVEVRSENNALRYDRLRDVIHAFEETAERDVAGECAVRTRMIMSSEATFRAVATLGLLERHRGRVCAFATIREPVSWCGSAVSFNAAVSRVMFPYVQVRNYQTGFLAGTDLSALRSLTVATLPNLERVAALLWRHFGMEPKQTRQRNEGKKSVAVDWTQWVKEHNPLDFELYSLVEEAGGLMHLRGPPSTDTDHACGGSGPRGNVCAVENERCGEATLHLLHSDLAMNTSCGFRPNNRPCAATIARRELAEYMRAQNATVPPFVCGKQSC